MGILDDLRLRVSNVNDGITSGDIIRDVIVQHPDDILELQKKQLFAGLSSSGEDIRPYYSEDLKPSGYFHTVESAKRYSVWKEGLSYPYSVQRNPDAPNLYINGRLFHDNLGVQFDTRTLSVVAMTAAAKRVMDKYGMQTFGLMWSNWMQIWEERGAYEELMQEIKSILYVNN